MLVRAKFSKNASNSFSTGSYGFILHKGFSYIRHIDLKQSCIFDEKKKWFFVLAVSRNRKSSKDQGCLNKAFKWCHDHWPLFEWILKKWKKFEPEDLKIGFWKEIQLFLWFTILMLNESMPSFGSNQNHKNDSVFF